MSTNSASFVIKGNLAGISLDIWNFTIKNMKQKAIGASISVN